MLACAVQESGDFEIADSRPPQVGMLSLVSFWGAARRWVLNGSSTLCLRVRSLRVLSAQKEVRDLRVLIESQLSSMGLDTRERDGDMTSATLRWRLFGALLAAAEDPDAEGITGFVRGVPLGVGVKLPRLPAPVPKEIKLAT